VADRTLDQTQPDDVLGAPDPALVKRWSQVGAADSLASAHNKRVKRQRQMVDAAATPRGELTTSEGSCDWHAGEVV
jgi:hypothetical protein